MWTTIAGKTETSFSGAEIVPPRLTDSCTLSIAFSTTLLPAVLPVTSMAWRIGTPALTSADRVRYQRARATFWTTSPIRNGIRSRKRSHWGRPQLDRFQAKKLQTTAITITITRYHLPVMKSERPTVNFVSAGSLPPKSLNTFANTGTMNATSASRTAIAKEMTTAG